MKNTLAEVLHRSVSESLENMAFIEARPVNQLSCAEDRELLAVSLLMHEPVTAEFRMLMSRGLLLKITEALFGVPVEELEDSMLKDAFAELLNTIVGQFLNQAYPDTVYRLGLPEEVEPYEGLLEEDSLSCCYQVGEELFQLACCGEIVNQVVSR